MKYGTILVIIAIVNAFVMFSGLPMNWKKVCIIITSLFLLFMGWALRAATARKKARALERARNLEKALDRDLDHTVNQVANDVVGKIETEIKNLSVKRSPRE